MVDKESLKTKRLKYEARLHSIKEGIFCSARSSFGDEYVSPFAIAINASNSMVALLTAIIGLLGPLSQTFGSRLIEKYSRKKIVLKAAFFEALMWLPLILLAFLYYKGIIVNILPFMLLLFFAFYVIFANVAHPAWFSWMGDIISEKHRGRWFSKRNLIIGFVSIILAIAASFFLDYFKQKGLTMIGFGILFLMATIARLISWRILKKQYEPKIELEKGYYFSFFEFIVKAPKTNFGRFTIFRSLLGFSAAISSPLLAVYLLRYLGFNYVEYIIIMLGGTFVSLFFLGLWGKVADIYGDYKVLIIASILVPIVDILWILHTNILYLLFIPSVLSGIAWAGIYLASGNLIYDNVTPQRRGLVVSYYNMVWGIGVFLGAGLGALLIKFLNTNFLPPIILVFIISSIVSVLVIIFGLPQIKEVRKTKKLGSIRDFEKVIFKKAGPTIMEEIHELKLIKKYLNTK